MLYHVFHGSESAINHLPLHGVRETIAGCFEGVHGPTKPSNADSIGFKLAQPTLEVLHDLITFLWIGRRVPVVLFDCSCRVLKLLNRLLYSGGTRIYPDGLLFVR